MDSLQYMKFLYGLAEQSGSLIERYFLSGSFEMELKPDRTVVTQADREAEDLIRCLIRKEFPDHGVIGEEFGTENENAEFVWVIDPIDGTLSFAGGVPLFGSLIGLLYQGKPLLGCIHQPVLHLLCVGDGQAASCNGKSCVVGNTSDISQAMLLTTDIGAVDKYQSLPRFEELRREVKVFRTWGDCYGYLLVALGRADIMLDPIMNPWDLLPLIPVIQGAGGIISGWDGAEATTASSAIATNSNLHKYVMSKLQSTPSLIPSRPPALAVPTRS